MKYESYLEHHGILGQKWGVRRYQNADGSLTDAGRKRYLNMSPDKVRKKLYKDVKKMRSSQSGWSNQWNVRNTIGKNSEKAEKKYWEDRLDYEFSEKGIAKNKKLSSLNKHYDTGKIDDDQYDDQWGKIQKQYYRPELDNSVRINNGRHYAKEYLDTYGKNINIGYLMDLGYSKESSEFLNEIIMKADKKLLNGM